MEWLQHWQQTATYLATGQQVLEACAGARLIFIRFTQLMVRAFFNYLSKDLSG
jgi:hypothetical protein